MVDFALIIETAKIVLTGGAAAAVAAGVGYIRAHFKDGESFNLEKFTQLALLGAVWGGAAAGMGWTPLAVEEFAVGLIGLSAISLLSLKAAQALVSFVKAKLGR